MILGFNGVEILSKHPFITLNQFGKQYPNLFTEFLDDLNLEERIRNEERYRIYQKEHKYDVELMRNETRTLLPENLDYLSLKGLSGECREKLQKFKPRNMAAASRCFKN